MRCWPVIQFVLFDCFDCFVYSFVRVWIIATYTSSYQDVHVMACHHLVSEFIASIAALSDQSLPGNCMWWLWDRPGKLPLDLVTRALSGTSCSAISDWSISRVKLHINVHRRRNFAAKTGGDTIMIHIPFSHLLSAVQPRRFHCPPREIATRCTEGFESRRNFVISLPY